MQRPAHLTFDALERAPEAAGTHVLPSEYSGPAEPDFSLNRLYYSSGAAHPRLRIGVMINRDSAPQLFMRKVLEDIRNCDFARLECIIENCEPPVTPRPAGKRSLASRVVKRLVHPASRQSMFYYGYVRLLDARRGLLPNPYAAADCGDLLDGVPRVEVVPLRQRFVHRFPPEAIDRIRSFDLDVILRFGFNIIRGDILGAARHGVWSYHHGDSECYRGGPSQLWEIMEGNPLTGAVLQRLDESLDAGPVLRRAILSTSTRPWVSMNRFNVYWSTQHFVIQKLYELHRYGPEHIEQRTHRCGAYRGKRQIYRKPSNLDMAQWLAPLAIRSVRRKFAQRSDISHWRIGLRKAPRPLYEDAAAARAPEFTWLDSPRGRFWADPFLIEEGGDTWMFFEDYSRAEMRGVISCGKVVDGQLREVRSVLQRPHHLSYPYVFKHAGAVWMVPESEQAGKVQLYRAARFPDDWVLERTLLDLRAVDSSLFQFGGKWWLLTSPLVVRGHAPSTFLFVAPEPWGPWKLHPAGCVCSDVRWARGAGSIIVRGDRVIRPSQDCSKGYGYSISFNEMKLSDTHYEEEHGAQLLPDAVGRIAGVHTYNRVGSWEVIDGRAPMPRRDVL
jgi:hypothetical protein